MEEQGTRGSPQNAPSQSQPTSSREPLAHGVSDVKRQPLGGAPRGQVLATDVALFGDVLVRPEYLQGKESVPESWAASHGTWRGAGRGGEEEESASSRTPLRAPAWTLSPLNGGHRQKWRLEEAAFAPGAAGAAGGGGGAGLPTWLVPVLGGALPPWAGLCPLGGALPPGRGSPGRALSSARCAWSWGWAPARPGTLLGTGWFHFSPPRTH